MSPLDGNRRRWLSLTLAALVVAAVFVRLGYWQLDRAHRDEHRAPIGPVQLAQVSLLGQGLASSNIGALVTATGHYDAGHQVVVQRTNGQAWVLTPLLLADGGALAVVRGLGPADSPPQGAVVVTGAMEASEPATGSGAMSSINTEQLVAQWPYSIHDGYLALTQQRPSSSLTPISVPARRTPGLHLLNLMYAIQWWIFAAFALAFAGKVIRDDVVAARSGRSGPG